MAFWNNKEVESLKQQLIQVAKEKNDAFQLVQNLQREKERLLEKANKLEMQLNEVENKNEQHLKDISKLDREVVNKVKTFSLTKDELEDSITHVETLLLQKSKLIEKYYSRDAFNDYLSIKEHAPNIFAIVEGVTRNLRGIFHLLKLADHLETLRRIEMSFSTLERSRKLVGLISQFDDIKDAELGKVYRKCEETIIKREFNSIIELLSKREKETIFPEIEQLIILRDKLKKELSVAGYRNFSAIMPKKDRVRNSLIIRKEGQSEQEYYSNLFRNADNFDEAINLYCNNTPYNDLLLTSKLNCIRNILLSENLISRDISSNGLYDIVKKVSTKLNSNDHK